MIWQTLETRRYSLPDFWSGEFKASDLPYYCVTPSSNSRCQRFACLNTTQVSLTATQSSHRPKISLGPASVGKVLRASFTGGLLLHAMLLLFLQTIPWAFMVISHTSSPGQFTMLIFVWLQGYKVQVNDSSINDAASAFKIVCNLNPGNIYTVSVWAYSEVGEGPKASISFSTQTLSKSHFVIILIIFFD